MSKDIKICSYNVKGLTDPSRAIAIKNWMKDNSFQFDILCLQEIKCTNFILDSNLSSNQWKWFHSVHEVGKGGTTIGFNQWLVPPIKKVSQHKHWVSIELYLPFNIQVVSVYAPCNNRERTQVWKDLSLSLTTSVICGDFNMVDSLDDRHQGKGYVVQGLEIHEWLNLFSNINLVDCSSDTGFTWSNKQLGDCFRAARLDRFLLSCSLINRWPFLNYRVDNSIQLSDHKPVIMLLISSGKDNRTGWFHVDPTLFYFPEVQTDVQNIILEAFNNSPSPALSPGPFLSKLFDDIDFLSI